MSDRKTRVGELIQRELSDAIHSRWRAESVAITITGVDIAPDLKKSRVFYSVIGNREAVARAGKFLMSIRNELRYIMGKNVILKFTPEIKFVYDPSVERGMRLLSVMDELKEKEAAEVAAYDASLAEDLKTQKDQDCDGTQHQSQSEEEE